MSKKIEIKHLRNGQKISSNIILQTKNQYHHQRRKNFINYEDNSFCGFSSRFLNENENDSTDNVDLINPLPCFNGVKIFNTENKYSNTANKTTQIRKIRIKDKQNTSIKIRENNNKKEYKSYVNSKKALCFPDIVYSAKKFSSKIQSEAPFPTNRSVKCIKRKKLTYMLLNEKRKKESVIPSLASKKEILTSNRAKIGNKKNISKEKIMKMLGERINIASIKIEILTDFKMKKCLNIIKKQIEYNRIFYYNELKKRKDNYYNDMIYKMNIIKNLKLKLEICKNTFLKKDKLNEEINLEEVKFKNKKVEIIENIILLKKIIIDFNNHISIIYETNNNYNLDISFEDKTIKNFSLSDYSIQND